MAINKVQTIDDRVRVKTVLASVSDKSGLDLLVQGLLKAIPGVSFLSTGGTHAAIQKILGASGSESLRHVSAYTGQPEMQGGLVKTLDYKIYLGLLSETYNASHTADCARAGAVPIDMVVANLYPFEETIAAPSATLEDARGNIDIGGPCMVRAAAKNFHRVAVLTDPGDYPAVIEELSADGMTCLSTRFRLAQKAFRLIARYDEAIAAYLSGVRWEAARGSYAIVNGG